MNKEIITENIDVETTESKMQFIFIQNGGLQEISSEEQEIDNLIIKLELFLRPSVNGLCLACYHEKIFRDLCKK